MSEKQQRTAVSYRQDPVMSALHNSLRDAHVILNATSRTLVNMSIKSWNQLPAGLIVSFPCKLNTLERGL